MRDNFRGAEDAASVYPSDAWHNHLLLRETMKALSLTAAEASIFLNQRISFPSGKSKSGTIVKPIYRYLKQTVSYFYTTIRQTAVKEFVKCLHERSDEAIGQVYKPAKAKRGRIVLSKEEAMALLSDRSLMDDMLAWSSVLGAVAAAFKRVGAGEAFEEDNPLTPKKVRSVCLLAHLALVMVKIREHLRSVAGVQDTQHGMNAGHRGTWVVMLSVLHTKFVMSSEPQRGLRLRDGQYDKRAVEEDADGDNDGLADFGINGSHDDDVDDPPAGL